MKKIALSVFAICILHSYLFYGNRWGISVVLFTMALMALFIYSLKDKENIKNKKALLLSIPITLISLSYGLFNNIFFKITNFFVIIGLTCIMLIWAIYGEFNITSIISNTVIFIFKPVIYIPEAVKLIISSVFGKNQNNISNDTNKEKISENKVIKQILSGLIISIPLLIVILALLMSADTVFAQILEPIKEFVLNIFNLGFWFSVYFRIIVFSIVCIYIMAFVCNILKSNTENMQKTNSKGLNMQNITVNTVLTILNIVYLLFVIVQFTHLFTQIGQGDEIYYADYARKGFFQLMIVTFINFAIILITNANKIETTMFTNIYTKIMNLFLIIFTAILIFSSFVRMYIYEQQFGYTFLRLLVYFILITELILIIPTIVYVFNKKIKLLKCYIVIFAVMYTLANFVNVDKTIARKNVDRYIANVELVSDKQKSEIDFNYLRRLSTDAIPDIIRLYNKTKDKILKEEIKIHLDWQYQKTENDNEKLPEFNFQKENSKRLLQKWNLTKQWQKSL